MNDMTKIIETHYATESESAALGHINIASFQHQPFWPNVMPGIDLASCLPLKQARCLEKLVSPNIHVFSAVDTGVDRVVGYARWTVPWAESKVELSDEGKALLANAGNLKPEGMREEIYEAFFKVLKEKRNVYLKDDDMSTCFSRPPPFALYCFFLIAVCDSSLLGVSDARPHAI
jgi:hypothetical protein